MDGGDETLKPLSISEWLDQMCVYYMGCGVTYEEFWFGNYCKLKYYERLNEQKKDMESQRLWLQGLYNYNAFGTVLANAFKDKGAPLKRYMEEPIRLSALTPEEIEQKKIEEGRKIAEKLNSFARLFNGKRN